MGILDLPNAITVRPRTPGYRFKDGRLMIFTEGEVMLIRGWDDPSALQKCHDSWEPLVPEFRLVAPYRRAAKKVAKPGGCKPDDLRFIWLFSKICG